MKNIRVFFIFSALIFPYSCTKKVSVPSDLPQIEYGSADQMSIISVNGSGNIDLDKDGSPDLMLKIESVKIMGPNYRYRYTLQNLNSNLRFRCDHKTDTLFMHRNMLFSDSQVNDTITLHYKTKETIFTCHRISALDSISSIKPNQFKIFYASRGENSKPEDSFESGDRLLFEGTDFLVMPGQGQWPDTINYAKITYQDDCGFPFSAEKNYIGFKLLSKSKERIGWVRLDMLSHPMRIFESAISQ
ncbi:MAG: hypothetical protein PSX36_05920 [bacterium]|nr:hypothetical protein [bacterium]